jgi:hypothetical protein
MQLRKIVAESGLDYDKVAIIFTSANPTTDEQNNQEITNDEKEQIQEEEDEAIKAELKCKIPDANDQDLEELIELFQGHFRSLNISTANNIVTNALDEENKSTSHNPNDNNSASNNTNASNNSPTTLGNRNQEQKPYKKKGPNKAKTQNYPTPNASRSSVNAPTKKSNAPKVSGAASSDTITNSMAVEK